MEINLKQGESIALEPEEVESFIGICNAYGIKFHKYFNSVSNIFTFPLPFVGYIKLLGKDIYIQPRHEKFTLAEVFMMKLCSFNLNQEAIIVESFQDFISYGNHLPALTELFVKELTKTIKKGMPLEFKKRAVRTENFSGNVNILQTQLNLFLKKKKPVVTTKDNLTIETPIGFLFNKAVEKIKTSINPADYHFFIEHLPSSAPKDLRFIDKIDIARNALHTSRCVQLAKAILFDLIPVNLKGKDLGEAFLINYDYLFEHFIAHVLMTSKAGYLFSKPKIPTKYAEFFKDEKVNEKEVLPDIAYNEMNVGLKIKYNGVLDVKNKYPSIFSNGDVFQVLYYSQKFNSDRAILIYPSAETQCYTKLELEEKIPVEVYACYFNIKSLSDGSFVKERERFADEILSLLC